MALPQQEDTFYRLVSHLEALLQHYCVQKCGSVEQIVGWPGEPSSISPDRKWIAYLATAQRLQRKSNTDAQFQAKIPKVCVSR